MTKAAEELFRQAMLLDPAERHDLIDELSAVHDQADDPTYAMEWDAELQRRIDDVDQGRVVGIPWEQVRDQLGRGDRDAAR